MKAYKNDKLDFQIDVPEEWILPRFSASSSRSGKLIAFKCKYYERFEIHVKPLTSQPSCKEIETDFKDLKRKYSYASFSFGKILINGREHVWARYCLGGMRWKKIYKIIIATTQYEFTAICMNQNMLLEREKVWDNVVTSFRNSQSQENYTPAPPKQQAPIIEPKQKPSKMNNPAEKSEIATPPGIKAASHILQASTYLNKSEGNPVNNLTQAIEYYKKGIEFFTRQDHPTDWASAQNDMGEAYRRLSLFSNRQGNLNQSVFHYRRALECLDPISKPEVWAAVHNNLGIVYANGVSGDKANNLEKAIQHCKQALEIYTHDAFPHDWAMTQNNLGSAYTKRILGKRADNLDIAVFHLNQALLVQATQLDRGQWAGTHYNLMLAYWNKLIALGLNNSEEVIYHCQQALKFYTRINHPNDWAFLHNRLGSAYQLRTQGNESGNLGKSAYHSELALQYFSQRSNPTEWASAKNNIGQAVHARQYGNRADNIEKAISCFMDALKVYTLYEYPEKWASTQNYLAFAYQDRIYDEKEKNIDKAINCFQQALEGFTQKAYPEQWATTQFNLACAYASRPHGIRSYNQNKALHHCEQAMKIQTRQTNPSGWALNQFFLGTLIFETKKGELTEYTAQATHHYQQALEVYTQKDYPDEWGKVQERLIIVAREQKVDDRSSSLTYPQFYFKESTLHPGEQNALKLRFSTVPDIPYVASLLLVYEWDALLTEEEKSNLINRAIVYISCAIYDVAIQAGLACQPSQIPNGRRPAWILEGEVSPISLIVSEIHKDDNTCHMTIGPMVVQVGKTSGGKNRWEKLHANFKSMFSEIKV